MIEVYVALSLLLVVALLTVLVKNVLIIQREHSKLDGLHRFLEGSIPDEKECNCEASFRD